MRYFLLGALLCFVVDFCFYPLLFEQKWLSTELVTASRIGDTGSEKERHEAKLKLFSKERPLVFTIPFFCQEFCSLFVEDFRQIQRTIEFAPLVCHATFCGAHYCIYFLCKNRLIVACLWTSWDSFHSCTNWLSS